MSSAYTFRYLNADGKVQCTIFARLDDIHSAELRAELLMPRTASCVEVWLDNDLISRKTGREIQDDTRSSVAPACG